MTIFNITIDTQEKDGYHEAKIVFKHHNTPEGEQGIWVKIEDMITLRKVMRCLLNDLMDDVTITDGHVIIHKKDVYREDEGSENVQR